MDCKIISDTPNFKGFNVYNATTYVQDHTLINRGITTLGGSTIPQCAMSNNKYEAQERALMGGIYFIASYLTPIMLIPLYNKHFLKNKKIIDSTASEGKKIILLSKKFLTPSANLEEGLNKTAELLDKSGNLSKEFAKIYKKYANPQKLKKDLLSVHEKVLATDFITTAIMWSSIPWIATEFTEHRTKRKDFSAGFNLTGDKNSEKKNAKSKKILGNILFCTIPGILFSKTITKGLSTNLENMKVKNIFQKGFKKILNYIQTHPQNFDYASGTNMSKSIYAAIWILSSFPSKLISSRDKNECKDRALRDIGLFTMFFGGDFLINNILGRTADKLFGTKIMKTADKKLNFIQRFSLGIKNFRNLDSDSSISKDVLKKTKKIGAGIYWLSLLSNTALIGFALPKLLNKFLRYNIQKQKTVSNESNFYPKVSMNDLLR